MIEIKNVVKKYDNFIALDNVNITIKTGLLTIIVGKSGSGKSTLLNLIGCLDKPTNGEIVIDDYLVSNKNPNELCEFRNKNIGFIYQSFFLESDYSVLENVMIPLIIRGEKRKNRIDIAKQAIEKVGLLDKIFNKASNLSGGEKQRVTIARCLAQNPNIILADEPTGNLDTETGNEIINILLELKNEGKTIVLVTHNNEYLKYADDIIKISDGRIINND